MAMDVWQNFSTDIFGFAMSSFSSLEPWLYPLIFIGIFGYIYSAMESIVVTVVAILITFGIFAGTTSIFESVPQINQFFYIISVIGITLLIATLIVRKRR